ncbi:hypothetical protein AVEN_183867-1 [Araneus ventricosus]|uniref:Uncharacterized protein n=1 Tax=Araneus ventricosus TaxID=182803 RepID=A0A4Y2FPU0_ARAVE|nr:hypothetical protein AVEN_183867-1 [Araneus ventricosus]
MFSPEKWKTRKKGYKYTKFLFCNEVYTIMVALNHSIQKSEINVIDDPRRSADLYQVQEPVYPEEIQSQQRIRNKILLGKPQACKNKVK